MEQWQEDLNASFEARLFPIPKAIADRWAILTVQTQRRGQMLANIDGLIAATDLEHNLTLVTRNVKDFAKIEMPIFNPWEAP